MTKEQAVALHDSGAWKEWSHPERALFQMTEDRLCMPFDVFHESIEKALGRPVYTHELALSRTRLVEELLGQRDAPTMDQILNLVPTDKCLVVVAP